MTTASVAAAKTPRPLGLIAVASAILCFSVSSSLILKAGIPGPTTAFWRMLVTIPVWWTILWLTERSWVTWADLRRALLPGMLFGLNLTVFFEGVHRTSVANAEFIAALTPLILVPAGALIYGERIIPKALWFGLVSVLGLAIVLFTGPASGAATWQGNVIVALGTVLWAAYLLASRRLRGGNMSVQRIMASMMPIATLTVFPIVLGRGLIDDVTAEAIPYILALALLTGTLAHGFIVFAQKTVPVGTISLMQVAQPALAVGWAYLLLDQELRPVQLLGMVLVMVGLIAIFSVTRRAQPLPEAVEVADEAVG